MVLLPAVYRLWAAARAAEMRNWLAQNGAVKCGASASAAAQATNLALVMHVARCRGFQVQGIAVDWSKCYDRPLLSALEDFATGAGISPSVARLCSFQ